MPTSTPLGVALRNGAVHVDRPGKPVAIQLRSEDRVLWQELNHSLRGVLSKDNMSAPLDRADGRSKVTGNACTLRALRPDLACAVLVQSSIPKGRIKSIERGAAMKAAGVLD